MIPFISYDTLFQHYFQFLFNRWKTDVCVTALIADGTLCFPLSTTGDFVPENGFIVYYTTWRKGVSVYRQSSTPPAIGALPAW